MEATGWNGVPSPWRETEVLMLLESVVAVRFPNFGLPHAMVKGDQTMYIYILYQTISNYSIFLSFDPYPCDIMWRCRPPLQVISVEQVLQHENLEENDLKSLLCSSYHFGEVGWFFGWCKWSASARRCKLKNMAMSETNSTIFIGKIQQYTLKQW